MVQESRPSTSDNLSTSSSLAKIYPSVKPSLYSDITLVYTILDNYDMDDIDFNYETRKLY